MDPLSPDTAGSNHPSDLQVCWGSGATHAEWGREEGTLNAQGDFVWVKNRGSGSDAIREESRGHATKSQMDALWRAILDNRFFDLKESYQNLKVVDGFSEFIVVTANGGTHSVAVMNTSQKNFSKVMSVLDGLRAAEKDTTGSD